MFHFYTDCIENTYGRNCEHTCSCNVTNAASPDQSCNAVTGACLCRVQWAGPTCDVDVDECQEAGLHQCNATDNRECANTVGNYECPCRAGFTENDQGNCQEG